MRFLGNFEKIQPVMRLFDWIMAFGSLGYGLFNQNWWWIAGGMLGFAIAWYDPGTRIRNYFAFIKPAQRMPAKGGNGK